MFKALYANKRVFDDVIEPEKGTGSKMTQFSSTSGTCSALNWQMSQAIQFNAVQPLKGDIARNFMLNGEFDIIYTYTQSVKGTGGSPATDNGYFEFVKSPAHAFSMLVSCNGGGVSKEYNLGLLEDIYSNYTDKYKAYYDKDIQFYYSKRVMDATTLGADDASHSQTKTATVYWSIPIYHPLLQCIGQCDSLNIRIQTAPGFYNLIKTGFTGDIGGDGSTVHTDPSWNIKISIKSCTLTYDEYQGADTNQFSFETDIFEVYPKAFGGNNSQSSDNRNTNNAPHDVFVLVERDPALFSGPKDYTTTKTLPLTGNQLNIDVQNNMNVFNAGDKRELLGRCLPNGWKGSCNDWYGTNDKNQFSNILRIPMRSINNVDPMTVQNFRFEARHVQIGHDELHPAQDADGNAINLEYATLYVIYLFKGIIKLSSGGGENTIQVAVNPSEAFVGEIEDGSYDDMVGGWSFGSLLNKGINFIKKGGLSKLANTASTIGNIVKPGNKFSEAVDSKVNPILNTVGLSSSIF